MGAVPRGAPGTDWRCVAAALASMAPAARRRLISQLPLPAQRAVAEAWRMEAHDGQLEPEGPWRVWLIMAGRGFGKTRAGAEWVWAQARAHPGARIALVAATREEVDKVMIEGESGLIAAARSTDAPRWVPSRGEIDFGNGAIGQAWSAAEPGRLRGPQHHFAWCDEIAKWRRGQAAWDNLRLGLRLGERPRLVATTTPAPGALLTAVSQAKETALTRGRTVDNPHLPESFVEAMIEAYGGTRLGRQELDGMLLNEAQGALWSRALIERQRAARAPEMARVVIGVDPPAGTEGDACGIVACGLGVDGRVYVLGDHSVRGLGPAGWAARVAAAAEAWEADRVVAEANNGGAMVREVLGAADSAMPVTLVHASQGKGARAEPASIRFENGSAFFAGHFPELEDELCAMTACGGYEGPGRSPDRADAMVWAMKELRRARRAPGVRAL